MFGLELTHAEWAGLVAMVFLVGRILYAFGRVAIWYATDARRPVGPHGVLAMLTAIAVATLMVALVSSLTDWPAAGLKGFAYSLAVAVGCLLGFMFDIVIEVRVSHFSNWLTAFRLPQYREQLLHSDAAVRLDAAERLVTIPQYTGPARPELLTAFRRDESADVRAMVGQTLLYSLFEPLPEDDGGIVAEARAAIGDRDVRVRAIAAAMLLTYKAAPPGELVPVLIEGVRCTDENVVTIAVQGMEKLGPDAAPAVDALRDVALRPEHPNLFATSALQKIGSAAVPALVEVLERGQSYYRCQAADALGEIGEPAAAAIPALRKAAAGPNTSVSSRAKRALAKLGAPARQ